VIGRLADVKANSGALTPVSARFVITRLAVPVLLSVIAVGALLVWGNWLAKVKLGGLLLIAGAVPTPDRATACGLPTALSVIDNEAARLPTAVGVKVRFTVVLLPAVTLIGNEPAANVKSPAFAPVIPRPVIDKLAVPVLVIVTGVTALVAFTSCLPKLTVAGLIPTPGAMPVPDRVTVCGLPLALSAIVSEAVRLPVAVGVKVTFTVMLLPGVTVIGNEPAAKAKSPAFAPVIARLEVVRLAVPVLAMMMGVTALLVFTSWLPKLTATGLTPKTGAMPVPLRGTLCGLPAALSVIDSETARLPLAAGVKVTFTVVLFPGGTVIGSVPAVKPKLPALAPVIARFVITRLPVPALLTLMAVGALLVLTS